MGAAAKRTLLRLGRRVPGYRRAVESPEPILRYFAMRGAWVVTNSVRFALNELFKRRVLRSYLIRRTGRRIFVRHPLADAWVIDEVIRRQVYRPPAQVRQLLDTGSGVLRIADLGGHIGASTLLLLELFPRAHLLAVEPNPDNAGSPENDGRCQFT